ncbi:MAG: hypothetical protein KKA79_10030 [Nanoarchaeota archaeon]|nr:hypothetical protein [Nanoarchaeota archaeon]MCG2718715.1 hypothetical protein [Nanoarchaeota archaeon]
MEILSLFKKKIRLHSKKYRLMDKLEQTEFNPLYVKELKKILKEEQKTNRELKKESKSLSKFVNLSIVQKQITNLDYTTKKQLEILSRIRFKIFKKQSFKLFKEECNREVEQSKFLSKILKESVKETSLGLPKEEFEEGKLLVKQAQKTYRELKAAIGNVRKVQTKAKELILINRKLKKTKLYEFIKYDVDVVTGKAKYALNNPKESKLRFVLAGAYIISPGTFELTGIYLIFRYIGKYAKESRFIKGKRAGASSANDRTIPN